MKILIQVFLGIIIVVIIYLLGKSLESQKETQINANKEAYTPTSSSRSLPTQTSPNGAQNKPHASQRELNATGLIRLDSSVIPILFNPPHITLTDEEILERIEKGVELIESYPYPGPMASHRRPNVAVTSIDQACKLLHATTPIPIEWFPQWGYEVDDYYIFSGGAEHSAEDAFKRGFAIQKNNGRSWRYHNGPIPVGKRRTEKGPRPNDPWVEKLRQQK